MTGRGAGYCAGYPVTGFMNAAWGQFPAGFAWRRGGTGLGWGRGGRGWRRRNWCYASGVPGWNRVFPGWPGYPPPVPAARYPQMSRDQELAALTSQAQYLEQALERVRSLISDMGKSAESSTSE